MSSKRMPPWVTTSGFAPSRSTTSRGCATVVMPSCTVPMSSKMPLTTHMIQPDMLLMRITSPVDSAMSPAVIAPRLHSHSPRADVPTISSPLNAVMLTSIAVVMRVIRRTFSALSAIASPT